MIQKKTEERNRLRNTSPRQPLLPSTPHTLTKKLGEESSYNLNYELASQRSSCKLARMSSVGPIDNPLTEGLARCANLSGVINPGRILNNPFQFLANQCSHRYFSANSKVNVPRYSTLRNATTVPELHFAEQSINISIVHAEKRRVCLDFRFESMHDGISNSLLMGSVPPG